MRIVITDCEYRSAVSLVQALGRAGHTLFLVKSADNENPAPAFASRYAEKTYSLPMKIADQAYLAALEKICRGVGEKPVCLPVGAKTMQAICQNRAYCDTFCCTLLPSAQSLNFANDKSVVQATAKAIGIPVPISYSGVPDAYPVIVKPVCGEKFGLKAALRYLRADNLAQYRKAVATMRPYAPLLTQSLITGGGAGVCVVMDQNQFPAAVICHKRIREFPITGGPSTCCETFYDATLAKQSVTLLQALHYTGIAMVEWKGSPEDGWYLLEINPRVWGSFPLTFQSGSQFAVCWAKAAAGDRFTETDDSFVRGIRMRFVLNDTAAMLSLFAHGKFRQGFCAIGDAIRPGVREALYCKEDKAPFRVYLKNNFHRERRK